MIIKPIPRVVDLSHYDDVQDKFNGAKDFGIWGCINKVTEGLGGHDKSFDWRRQPCADRGILYGAYHFLRPGSIKQQVDHFLSSVGSDIKGLRLCLDHEDKRVPLTDAALFEKMVFDRTGQWPWLYSGFLIKEQLGNRIDPFWQNIGLWLCQYSSNAVWPKNWKTPILWQYTGDGIGPMPHNVPGIIIPGGKGIDINHYPGTHEQFVKDWNG